MRHLSYFITGFQQSPMGNGRSQQSPVGTVQRQQHSGGNGKLPSYDSTFIIRWHQIASPRLILIACLNVIMLATQNCWHSLDEPYTKSTENDKVLRMTKYREWQSTENDKVQRMTKYREWQSTENGKVLRMTKGW